MRKKLGIALLGLTLVFGFSTSNFAFASPGPLPAPVTTDTANDNGLINANKSGLNVSTNDGTAVADVIKSDGMNLKYDKDGNRIDGDVTQRTHGEYQNNTNSCASCHQTHTGAADNLLFKDGVYNTCTACHDGTLGFYNVFSPSTAGTFGGTAAGNASMHLANGVMETKAAPGGNQSGMKADGSTAMENWEGTFNCASCHEPHGSYSDRLLNFNPNEIASQPMYDDAAGTMTGTPNGYTGGQMVRDTVIDATTALPDGTVAGAKDFVVAETTAALVGIDAKYAAGTDKVVVVLKKDSKTNVYAKDTAPWINGGEYNHSHTFKVNFSTFYSGAPLNLDSTTNTQITTGITFNYQIGFAKVTSGTLVGKNADISRAYVVKFTFDSNVKWFGAPNSGVAIKQVDPTTYDSKTAATGLQISTFCAACHTDYLTASSTEAPTGVWSKAFRHSTNSASYTCLKCHFAHGSDVSVMLDAKDRSVDQVATQLFAGDTTKAHDYMLDKNPSSALKRYTNMSVCWKCHTQSHNVGLMNNDYVNNVQYDNDAALPETINNDRPNGWVSPDKSTLPYFNQQTPFK